MRWQTHSDEAVEAFRRGDRRIRARRRMHSSEVTYVFTQRSERILHARPLYLASERYCTCQIPEGAVITITYSTYVYMLRPDCKAN